MKKDWVKEAYRRWFSRLDEEVPEDAWNEIADQLDINEVWDNVSSELSKGPALSPWRWIARTAAVLLLLFSALAAYWYLSSSRSNRENQLSKETAPLPERVPDSGSGETRAGKRSSAQTSSAEMSATGETGLEENNPEENKPGKLSKKELPGSAGLAAGRGRRSGDDRSLGTGGGSDDGSVPPGIPPTARRAGIQVERTIQARNVLPASPSQALQAELPEMLQAEKPGELLARAPVTGDPAASSAGKEPFIRLQRLGMVSAYNNTWMLNHETFNGLQASTLNATTFTYGTSAAINAGFLVNGKHKIGAELYFSSQTGQGYRQYIEARYQSRNIQLDYYKIQLYYQLPVFSGRGDILAGAYGSYLKRGREEIAGEARTIGRFYRDIDYGIMAGYQFNLPVNNRLLVQPGIRISYGVPNIFKGNKQIPENFLRTHNAAAGLYLGISYRLD